MVELFVKIVNNFYFQINWRRKPFFSRRYFLVNFVKFLRPALLHNTFRSQLALLEYVLTRSYIMLKTNKPQVSMFDHFSILFLKGFWEWMRNVLVMFLMGLFSLRSWDCLSLLNWIGVPTKSQKLKLPSKKFEPWFVLEGFFLLSLFCTSINLPYGLSWNTLIMSGLVLLAATWKC